MSKSSEEKTKQCVYFLTDEPVIEDNFKRIADRIVDYVEDVRKECKTKNDEKGSQEEYKKEKKIVLPGPFSCAICGTWGSGKTSLLKALEEKFNEVSKKEDDENKYTVVLFEPWRYENEKNLIIPLLVDFHAKVKAKKLRKEVKDALTKTTKKLLGKLVQSVARTTGKVVENYTGFDPYVFGEECIKQYGDLQSDYKLSEVEQFKKDFISMIGLASDESDLKSCDISKIKPVIFLIDDLDRCSSTKIKKLLEDIKLFLHVPGAFFFVAMDDNHVTDCIKDMIMKNKTSPYDADARARKYLEKFFQLEILLYEGREGYDNAIDKLRKGINSHFDSHLKQKRGDVEKRKPKNAENHKTKETENKVNEIQKLLENIKPNPRTLKRAARWLHFELKKYGGKLPSDEKKQVALVRRFGIFVFSINWPREYYIDLNDKGCDGKTEAFSVPNNLIIEIEKYQDAGEDIISAYNTFIALKKEKSLHSNPKSSSQKKTTPKDEMIKYMHLSDNYSECLNLIMDLISYKEQSRYKKLTKILEIISGSHKFL